jgi:hypothetical protein
MYKTGQQTLQLFVYVCVGKFSTGVCGQLLVHRFQQGIKHWNKNF